MIKTKDKIKIAGLIYKAIKFLKNIFFKNQDLNDLYVNRNGINWRLDLSEGIDLTIFLFGNSEKNLNNLKKLLPIEKKLTFIDIGANIGSTSLNLVKQFKYSKIFAIEPTFYAFDKLKINISLNDDLSKQVMPVNTLISNQAIDNKIYSSWKINNDNASKVHKHHLGSPKKFTNEYISLDYFVDKFKINSVDFIKIDVDGNEKYVLESAIKTLEKFNPIIFLELAPYLYKENNYKFDDLDTIFQRFEYSYFTSELKKIENINKYVLNIDEGSSKNVYLIKNSSF